MRRPGRAGPPSDHCDGTRFFNPGGDGAGGGLSALLRWRRERRPAPWPAALPSPFADRPPERSESLRVSFIGHASLLIQLAGLNILVDPVFSQRASPVAFAGPRRFNPPGVAFDDLPPIDAVLVSHAHYDHLDLPTIRRLRRFDPAFVTALGNDAILRRAGAGLRVEAGDWGARVALSPRVEVALTPARHWSARTPFDRNRALWCGFFIRADAGAIYASGDTGYGDGAIFRALRREHGAPDVAVLPIGAYAPRWFMQAQHVDPAEAVAIFEACGAGHALGVHWGTFNLSDEAHDEPPRRLAEALAARNLAPERFRALRPGEVFDAGALSIP
ncbi:MBL fold metallo-hydrolase [Methylocella sp.]|uniref:MBL fold metallo-hydrolase n=1 Tax=Methylocella sp. TaxID=1978226 RepID=UPI003783841C